MNKESIVLGSGDLYCTDFEGTDTELPSNEEIEKEENRLGYIKGGASIEYKPSFYEAKDDMGKVAKVILTEEEATLKSGIMTWCGTTLEKLCSTARVDESKGNKRIVKIGGAGNATGKKYVLHFVHKDDQDGDIRVTVVGNNRAGFTIAFAKDSETVIDAEFKAQPQDKEGTLIRYEEDIEPKTPQKSEGPDLSVD
ncbi:MAG: SRPBCC family protein [Acetatifactor sp.]|nr:SRPBCC family protein [Acetatifactor sp.]